MPISLVKRHQMLDFLGLDFTTFGDVSPERIFKINDQEILPREVIYLMSREFRVEDNWGLFYAYEKSIELQLPLKVVFTFEYQKISARQKEFITNLIDDVKKNLAKNSISFEFVENNTVEYLNHHAGMVVVDFAPVQGIAGLAQKLNCACFEVDSHNIIPTRFASSKQEFSAAAFRPKIYKNIADFLNEYPETFEFEKGVAYEALEGFIQDRLDFYDEDRNDPNKNAVSNLSVHLHFGAISSQRAAIEVIKSQASIQNKEAFLEELIVRKELSDNFCLYNSDFASFSGIPSWGRETLQKHRNDLKPYIYDLPSFESAQTHENLWNACQMQLLTEGKIHGYLRMYWAKKILEWSISPEVAFETAVYLNDTYALDGNDPNGYVGILWSIGGLHDRPFFEREIFGKIRYMSENGCRRKFDVSAYVNRFISLK